MLRARRCRGRARSGCRSCGRCALEGLLDDRGEEPAPVEARAVALLDRVLGVRHEADDVAALVGDAGDVAVGAVGVAALGVGDVAEDDAPLPLEPVEGRLVGDETALAVLEDDRDLLAGLEVGRPRGRGVLDDEPLVDAVELAVVVADQSAGQQVALGEHLEAVADAEDGQATLGRRDERLHDRCEAGDGAAAQVVAVGEAAGEDDRVDAPEVRVAVPERDGLAAALADGTRRVTVVERTGERDDADLHCASSPDSPGASSSPASPASPACSDSPVASASPLSSTASTASSRMRTETTSSMTGLDRSVSAASRAAERCSSVTSPSTVSTKRLPWRTSVNPLNPSRGRAPLTACPCGSRISGLSMTSTTMLPISGGSPCAGWAVVASRRTARVYRAPRRRQDNRLSATGGRPGPRPSPCRRASRSASRPRAPGVSRGRRP